MDHKKINPARRLLYALGGFLLLGLVLPWLSEYAPGAEKIWLIALGVCAVFTAWDALQVRRLPRLDIQRDIPHTLPVNVWTPIKLTIRHGFRRAHRIELFEHYPQAFEAADMPLAIELTPGRLSHITYKIRAQKRGAHAFERCDIALTSPLGLWRFLYQQTQPTAIRVYPNFAAISQFQLLATDNHVSQMGIVKRQRRGEGLEFHQLRDYRRGDSLRQIDWKATAKRQQLISKEYQDERDQQVIFPAR